MGFRLGAAATLVTAGPSIGGGVEKGEELYSETRTLSLLAIFAHVFPHLDTATAVLDVSEVCVVALATFGRLVTHLASNYTYHRIYVFGHRSSRFTVRRGEGSV